MQVDDFGADIGKDLPGLRIGVIGEGFGHENSEADVNAAAVLAQRGAEVENINIPMHAYGFSIWSAFVHDGGYWAMQANRMRLGSQPPVRQVFPTMPTTGSNVQMRCLTR